jgi:kynurenine 3-monooxygenase
MSHGSSDLAKKYLIDIDRISPVPQKSAAQPKKVVVVGGGLAGMLTAIYMRKRGHDVHVVERRTDPHVNMASYVDQISSRAVGVSMTLRGIHAVVAAGIPRAELELCGKPIHAMCFVTPGGDKIRKLEESNGVCPLSLDRAAFQKLLTSYAGRHQVQFNYDDRCVDVDLRSRKLLIQGRDGTIRTMTADVIIGTDGAYSAIRQAMLEQAPRFSFRQSFFPHGYKTIVLPDAVSLGFSPHMLYFFGMASQGQYAARAATIPDGSISVAVCLPYEGPMSLATQDLTQIQAFFDHNFARLPLDVRREMAAQFAAKPANDFIEVQCSSFNYEGSIVLLGDAAHATVPFLGQGMNMALEDAYKLYMHLEESNDDFATALPAFTQARKPESDAMQAMAAVNYQVLSNSSFLFFLRLRYCKLMSMNFPSLYPPDMADMLYFTSLPYTVLRHIQHTQNRWYKFGRVA